MNEKIIKLIKPVLKYWKFELIDFKCINSKKKLHIKIFIDKEKGITLEDCSKMNKILNNILNIHEILYKPYILEVSSPGFDRSIKKDSDYLRIKGKEIKIKLKEKVNGQNNLVGLLVNYINNNNNIIIVIKVNEQIIYLPKNIILDVKVVYKF